MLLALPVQWSTIYHTSTTTSLGFLVSSNTCAQYLALKQLSVHQVVAKFAGLLFGVCSALLLKNNNKHNYNIVKEYDTITKQCIG